MLGAGLVFTARMPRTDRTRAALLLWGGWLVVTAGAFSLGQGIIHPYYTVALAPAIGALVGIGATRLWNGRGHPGARARACRGVRGDRVVVVPVARAHTGLASPAAYVRAARWDRGQHPACDQCLARAPARRGRPCRGRARDRARRSGRVHAFDRRERAHRRDSHGRTRAARRAPVAVPATSPDRPTASGAARRTVSGYRRDSGAATVPRRPSFGSGRTRRRRGRRRGRPAQRVHALERADRAARSGCGQLHVGRGHDGREQRRGLPARDRRSGDGGRRLQRHRSLTDARAVPGVRRRAQDPLLHWWRWLRTRGGGPGVRRRARARSREWVTSNFTAQTVGGTTLYDLTSAT